MIDNYIGFQFSDIKNIHQEKWIEEYGLEFVQSIESIAKKEKLFIGIREPGTWTVQKLRKGCPAKGCDINEKTIKESSIVKHYPKDYEKILEELKNHDLMGYVGHWNKEKGLIGIYLGPEHKIDPSKLIKINKHEIYLLDINNLQESLYLLKNQDHWQSIPFTGDFDLHEIFYLKRGSGLPYPVLLKEESQIIDKINKEIAVNDPTRQKKYKKDPRFGIVRHGPQYNLSAFLMENCKSKEKFLRNKEFFFDVSGPSFPILALSPKGYAYVENLEELKKVYAIFNIKMKESWKNPSIHYLVEKVKYEGSKSFLNLPGDKEKINYTRHFLKSKSNIN